MRIELTERFHADVGSLERKERALVLDVLLALPGMVGRPHAHTGVGVRKIHASGIWEARAGLRLRLVFALQKDAIVLVRAGDHDEISRYLRAL